MATSFGIVVPQNLRRRVPDAIMEFQIEVALFGLERHLGKTNLKTLLSPRVFRRNHSMFPMPMDFPG